MERHNGSREKYIASYIMSTTSLQWRDGDDLAVDVNDEYAGGGGALRRWISAAFPPPIFSGGSLLSLCFGFCVSLPPPCETPWGALYIGVFRSRGSFEKKDRRKRSHEAQKRGGHTARYRGWVGHPLLALRPPFACFLRSEVFLLPKNDPRKFAAHYDVVKALK